LDGKLQRASGFKLLDLFLMFSPHDITNLVLFLSVFLSVLPKRLLIFFQYSTSIAAKAFPSIRVILFIHPVIVMGSPESAGVLDILQFTRKEALCEAVQTVQILPKAE